MYLVGGVVRRVSFVLRGRVVSFAGVYGRFVCGFSNLRLVYSTVRGGTILYVLVCLSRDVSALGQRSTSVFNVCSHFLAYVRGGVPV